MNVNIHVNHVKCWSTSAAHKRSAPPEPVSSFDHFIATFDWTRPQVSASTFSESSGTEVRQYRTEGVWNFNAKLNLWQFDVS